MGTKETIVKYGKKFASGAKKAHGALVKYYGNPPGPVKGRKAAVRKSAKGTSHTIKVVHVHEVRTVQAAKKKRKAPQVDEDDFFSQRGLS